MKEDSSKILRHLAIKSMHFRFIRAKGSLVRLNIRIRLATRWVLLQL